LPGFRFALAIAVAAAHADEPFYKASACRVTSCMKTMQSNSGLSLRGELLLGDLQKRCLSYLVPRSPRQGH